MVMLRPQVKVFKVFIQCKLEFSLGLSFGKQMHFTEYRAS